VEAAPSGFGYGNPMSWKSNVIKLIEWYPRQGHPHNWHLTMLARGREPSLFTTLEEQLHKYKQLYRADQHFKEVKKMTVRVVGKSGKNKCKGCGNDKKYKGGDKKASEDPKGPTCYNRGTFGHIHPKCPHPQKKEGGYKGNM
jgi:hypothetical protein